MKVVFENRTEAGRFLANKLMHYANRPDVIVFGLPRGGVPVAYQVAQALNAPLDVFIIRKLGVPGHEELAMGAIATGGVSFLNKELIESMNISMPQIEAVVSREYEEMLRREQLYRGNRLLPDVRGQTVILVDDGLATGASMWAAVTAIRKFNPNKIVVAVPVASAQTCEEFKHLLDEVVCGITPDPFIAVGIWYEDFSETSDDEVRALLEHAPQLDLVH